MNSKWSEVYVKNGKTDLLVVDKPKNIEQIISNLYSHSPFEKWQFGMYDNHGNFQIHFGFDVGVNQVSIWYNGNLLNVQNKWHQIQNIFSHCQMIWSNYFELVTYDRIIDLKENIEIGSRYFQKYGKSIISVGEIGECLAAYLNKLWLSTSTIMPGLDALDQQFNRVQIKTAMNRLASKARSSRISNYPCDYVLFIWLNEKYELAGISKAFTDDFKAKLTKRSQITYSQFESCQREDTDLVINLKNYSHWKN